METLRAARRRSNGDPVETEETFVAPVIASRYDRDDSSPPCAGRRSALNGLLGMRADVPSL